MSFGLQKNGPWERETNIFVFHRWACTIIEGPCYTKEHALRDIRCPPRGPGFPHFHISTGRVKYVWDSELEL